jgi:hypothetical protein
MGKPSKENCAKFTAGGKANIVARSTLFYRVV